MKSVLEIKNQLHTDFCVGCAIASDAESIVGELCEESYSFVVGRKMSFKKLKDRGLQPTPALWGAIKYGVLPKRFSPYSIASHSRDFLADFNNWSDLQKYAVYPFGSFKSVGKDFETIYNTAKTESLIVGLYWQPEWNKNPIIDNIHSFSKYEPHEVRIIGVKDDKIVIQNSKGSDKGDNGLWYMSGFAAKAIQHAYILSQEKRSLIENFINTIL